MIPISSSVASAFDNTISDKLNNQNRFEKACTSGDIKTVNELISHPYINVNATIPCSKLLLMRVDESPNIYLGSVQALYGSDAIDPCWTLLQHCSYWHYPQVVKLLIDKGADVDDCGYKSASKEIIYLPPLLLSLIRPPSFIDSGITAENKKTTFSLLCEKNPIVNKDLLEALLKVNVRYSHEPWSLCEQHNLRYDQVAHMVLLLLKVLAQQGEMDDLGPDLIKLAIEQFTHTKALIAFVYMGLPINEDHLNLYANRGNKRWCIKEAIQRREKIEKFFLQNHKPLLLKHAEIVKSTRLPWEVGLLVAQYTIRLPTLEICKQCLQDDPFFKQQSKWDCWHSAFLDEDDGW